MNAPADPAQPAVPQFVTLGGGFALSFIGLGVLWVGTPVPYQFLMVIPFFLLAFGVTRFRGSVLPILWGALPIAFLMTQFRDKDDSHLMSVCLVIAWGAGILLGKYGAERWKAKATDIPNS